MARASYSYSQSYRCRQRGVHLGDNMEAVEDVDGLAAPLADHRQIRLPSANLTGLMRGAVGRTASLTPSARLTVIGAYALSNPGSAADDVADRRFRRRDLLRYNLQTVRAYLLKEDFQQFWKHESPSWAGKFLDEWCCQVMRSRIEPMKKIARTLRSHRALILNHFRARKQLSSCGRRSQLAYQARSQQQGQNDHAKILWLPHLPRHGNRAVPCTWQTAGA
jgi:hypothetical protein